jgi:hypothetical protein
MLLLPCGAFAQEITIFISTGDGTNEGIRDESYAWASAEAVVFIIEAFGGVKHPVVNNPPFHLSGGDQFIASAEVGLGFPFGSDGRFVHQVAVEKGTYIFCRSFNKDDVTISNYYGDSEVFFVYSTMETGDEWNIGGSANAPAFQADLEMDVLNPGPPISFEATPLLNGDILLTWVNTVEADLVSVEVRYKTDGTYPTSEVDGLRAHLGTAEPGAFDSAVHSGLMSGQTYYYSAFSFDDWNNPSYTFAFATVEATSYDTVSPEVEYYYPTGEGVSVNENVVIRFNERMNAASVEAAFAIRPSTATTEFTWTDSTTVEVELGTLSFGTDYLVSLETTAQDLAGNRLNPTPEVYPDPFSFSFATKGLPGPPISFEAEQEVQGDIFLRWVNTVDADVAGVEIRYKTDGTNPTTEVDGLRAFIGSANSGEADSTTHSNLTHGVTYYYSAFSYDGSSNYSETYATTRETAWDSFPPIVVSHTFPGTGLTIDVEITFSEPMSQESVESAFSIWPSTPLKSFSWVSNTVTCDLGTLQYGTTYYVTVEVTATDAVGNPLSSAFETSFATGAAPPDFVLPVISDFKIDGREVFNGDIISSTPRITARISDEGDPAKIASIEVLADSIQIYSGSPGSAFNTSTGTFEYLVPAAQPIPKGTYTLLLRAYDLPPTSNSTEESRSGIRVFLRDVGVKGPVLNLPNPFSPLSGQGTYISYNLKSDTDISVYVYDITSHLVWRGNFSAGSEGGRAGYNEVYWSGRSEFGNVVPNGMYIVRVAKGSDTLATSKITVID